MGVRDHLKHRLNRKTIAKEIFAAFTDKILPQGADEIGNLLFHGRAYLPWPGKGHLPPIPAPEAAAVPAPDPEGHGVHGPPEAGPDGTVLPPGPTPAAPSGGGPPRLEGPIVEVEWEDVTPGPLGYAERLDQIADRGGRDRGRGMDR